MVTLPGRAPGGREASGDSNTGAWEGRRTPGFLVQVLRPQQNCRRSWQRVTQNYASKVTSTPEQSDFTES